MIGGVVGVTEGALKETHKALDVLSVPVMEAADTVARPLGDILRETTKPLAALGAAVTGEIEKSLASIPRLTLQRRIPNQPLNSYQKTFKKLSLFGQNETKTATTLWPQLSFGLNN